MIGKEDGAQHDTKGIRLPNHKAVVSHVALDASTPRPIYYRVAVTNCSHNRSAAPLRSSYTSHEKLTRKV